MRKHDISTREDNTLFSHVKRSALLWLQNKSRVSQRRLCQRTSEMADDLPNWNLNILDPMDDDSKSRFIDVSKEGIDELIGQQENENTKKKTMYDLNIVLKFLREVRKEERELEKISPEELNVYLSEFIIAARTKKGEQYEPSSLRGILSSVDRYLTRREYGRRLFIDPEFTR